MFHAKLELRLGKPTISYPTDKVVREMLARACLNPLNSLEDKKWLIREYCANHATMPITKELPGRECHIFDKGLID